MKIDTSKRGGRESDGSPPMRGSLDGLVGAREPAAAGKRGPEMPPRRREAVFWLGQSPAVLRLATRPWPAKAYAGWSTKFLRAYLRVSPVPIAHYCLLRASIGAFSCGRCRTLKIGSYLTCIIDQFATDLPDGTLTQHRITARFAGRHPNARAWRGDRAVTYLRPSTVPCGARGESESATCVVAKWGFP
jgi:hypothetical protein